MRKVEIEIIMSEKSFFHYQLQEAAKTLIITVIMNGIIGINIKATQKWFIIVVLFNLLLIAAIRFFVFKRKKTKTLVQIDVDDGNVIIPKGAIIANSADDDLLFETVREYRFRKEENNEN
jgi:hypothetical protein